MPASSLLFLSKIQPILYTSKGKFSQSELRLVISLFKKKENLPVHSNLGIMKVKLFSSVFKALHSIFPNSFLSPHQALYNSTLFSIPSTLCFSCTCLFYNVPHFLIPLPLFYSLSVFVLHHHLSPLKPQDLSRSSSNIINSKNPFSKNTLQSFILLCTAPAFI